MKRRKMTKKMRTLQIYLRLTATAVSALIVCAIVVLVMSLKILSANTIKAAEPEPSGYERIKVYSQYSVQPGDTLWSIAEENLTPEYDSINKYIIEVMYINDIDEESVLQSGTYLFIPRYIDKVD
jgi:hypothetical protein